MLVPGQGIAALLHASIYASNCASVVCTDPCGRLDEASPTLDRLGLLAAACADGRVRLFAMPTPEASKRQAH